MERITRKLNKESLTTKLTLIIIGLTAGSALLIPATYASFHPVTTGEIADNTILSVDIANGQVRTQDIGDGQVRTGDIADRTISRADVAVGALNPEIQFVSGQKILGPNSGGSAIADCPSGYRATGGGFFLSNPAFLDVASSSPGGQNGWQATATTNSAAPSGSVWAYAICMGPIPP